MEIIIKGYKTLINKPDYEKIKAFSWVPRKTKAGQVYFSAWINGTKFQLHRYITNAPKGVIVDHKNQNSLDNRQRNLRFCTNTENQRNQKIKKGGSSKYKGVYWNKRDKRFVARIRNGEKTIYIGSFKCEKQAAIAYNKTAKKIHKEFASINKGVK